MYYFVLQDFTISNIFRTIANQFFSSFWIEQQWILEVEIEAAAEITVYLLRPYKYAYKKFQYLFPYFLLFREKWYDYPVNTAIRTSDQLSKSMHLHLYSISCCEDLNNLSSLVCDFTNVSEIYHLTIHDNIVADVLGRILTPLSTLGSLQITSLSLQIESQKSILDK
jgi:hypothetical protein